MTYFLQGLGISVGVAVGLFLFFVCIITVSHINWWRKGKRR